MKQQIQQSPQVQQSPQMQQSHSHSPPYQQEINMATKQTQPMQISQRQHTMTMSPPLTNSIYFSPTFSSQQSQPVYTYRDTNSQQIHQFYQYPSQQSQSQYQQSQQQQQQSQQQQQHQQSHQQQQQQYQQYYQPNMSDSYHSIMNNGQIKTYKIQRPYYQLEIYLPNQDTTMDLRLCYESLIEEHNKVALSVITSPHGGEFNAGFDLFVPTSMVVYGNDTIKIDHLVKCRMTKIIPHFSSTFNTYLDKNGILRHYYTTNIPVSFYLYPRSSTGTKTPLRLANSVGIIDSGYRGPLITAFDNLKNKEFNIQDKQRLAQVCSPDISYPIYAILIDNEEDLGKTKRGGGGFGSTG